MMTRRLFTALGAVPILAQQKKEEELPAAIKVDVDVVSVLCSVRDKKGALIANLAKEDFEVYEDGKLQTIKYFARETDLPLTIGMLIDVSVSQARLIQEEKVAGEQFFRQVLRKNDMAFLISFGGDSELLQDYTNSAALLRKGLDQLRVVGATGVNPLGMPGPVPTASRAAGTVMFDAVYLAATEKLTGETGRKAMVLITDGVDTGSRVRREEAIASAHKADAIIYSVYYVDHAAYGGGFYGGVSDGDLRRMSEDTGGRVLRVDRKHRLTDIFEEINQELRTQYSVGFTPDNADKKGEFRKLEVKMKNKDLRVQARKGYFATRQG